MSYQTRQGNYKGYNKKIDYRENTIEEHPFSTYIPSNATYLVIGTFPSHNSNRLYKFYYSGDGNRFWEALGNAFSYRFRHETGDDALKERKYFLEQKGIGITDMISKCYRIGSNSQDNYIYPILWNDIFSLLDQNTSIKTLVLTSRTPVIGALGHLKTYFMQKGRELGAFKELSNGVMHSNFVKDHKEYKVLIPYSPSRTNTENNVNMLQKVFDTFQYCFK